MPLNSNDLNKIAQLIRSEFKDAGIDSIPGKFDKINSDINILKDMVSDIQFRLDVSQIPSMDSQIESNTKRIDRIEEKLNI